MRSPHAKPGIQVQPLDAHGPQHIARKAGALVAIGKHQVAFVGCTQQLVHARIIGHPRHKLQPVHDLLRTGVEGDAAVVGVRDQCLRTIFQISIVIAIIPDSSRP